MTLFRNYLYVFAIVALLSAFRPLTAQTTTLTFVVNSTNDRTDVSPGDGKCFTGSYTTGTTQECTLRAAVDESRSGSASAYVIMVPAGTYNMTVTEPSCYYYDAPNAKVTLCPGTNVTIKGAGAGSTILDFGQQSRGFIIPQANTVNISGLTIQNATASNDNPYGGGGGGILNLGTLTLEQCTLFNNTSGNNGGAGVYTIGTLNVAGCSFQNNGQDAIRITSGTAAIDSSSFTATTSGTAAFYGQGGTTSITNSTFTANQSSTVLYLTGPATLTNTTIAGNNTSGDAVSISYSAVSLNNVTITGNAISNGFALDDGQALGGGSAPVYLSNSIVAANQSPYGDCVGPVVDKGHNLFGRLGYQCGPSDPTSKSGITDPKLSALEIDGSSVPTMTPLAGSPALGAGSTATPGGNTAGACTALDENGLPRGVGTVCSVGAAEPLRGFQVNHVTPTSGGAGGNITMVLTGSGFDPATTVVLRRSGQSDIAAQAQLPSPDATSLSAGFSLNGATLGTYDVVVTTSTATITLPASFTVAAPTSNTVQTFLSGTPVLRPGRPGTFVLTYRNPGNNDAYLVPLFLGLPFTGSIKGLQTPPANAQQILTDYSSSSLGVVPGTQSSTNYLPLLLPVVPAGSQNTLTFTVVATGSEGDKFVINQQIGIPYSSNPDTGVPDTVAINAVVSSAVLDDAANLGVTPSASAQSAMATYASSQLQAIVAAGQTALLQSGGAAPVVYSIPQLLDDVGAYGAAYTAPQASHGRVHPLYLPSPFNPPGPGKCDETPMAPGSSCNAPFAPFPKDPANNPCHSNALLEFIANQNGDCPPGNGGGAGGSVVGSVDPNLKTGPAGVGAAHYTLANTPFPYLIEFENQATASAPAQTVSVTDTLDTTKLDLSTFQFGPISFGSVPFVLNPPPGVTSFQGSVDLRPVDNIIVDVTAALNTSTGVVTWNFLSLDPATMQLTTDPTAGFLPPDTTPPAGIGHVAFTINPVSSVADAATICNTASIVFDTNAAIATAPYCNTKDTSPPTSQVSALPATQTTTSFTVSWSGTDAGSGVGTYTIYMQTDGGAFTPFVTATTATSATFTGLPGHAYGFYSIATDLLGNVEAAKSAAEATTTISGPGATFTPALASFGYVTPGSSATATVTLTSSGGMPLTITGFTLSDTTDFAQTSNCITTLNPGQTCTITLTFAPSTNASLIAATTATLALLSNAPAAPTPLALSGYVEGLQNIWVVNGNGTLSKLSNAGAAASPSSGLTGGGAGIAIDNSGDVWSGTAGGASVVEFDRSGNLLGTFSGGGIASPVALAIAGSGFVWIANGNSTLSLLQPNGTAVSPASGLSGGGLNSPSALAIDGSGNVWISNAGDSSLTEFLGAAEPVVTPLATAAKNTTQGARP